MTSHEKTITKWFADHEEELNKQAEFIEQFKKDIINREERIKELEKEIEELREKIKSK